MKTVLSIDFDIIMAPTIQTYNPMVPKVDWDTMAKDQPLCALAYPDYRHYQNLFNYIVSLLPKLKKENIYIIENHGKLFDYIPKNEYIDLINIDHHHDVTYPNGPQDKVTCANWVKCIADIGLLHSYTWVKNNNSESGGEVCKPYINNTYDFQELFGDNPVKLKEPDILVLCLSEPWVPPRVRPLFYLILDTLNNYYNTHFPIRYGESESDFKCKLKS